MRKLNHSVLIEIAGLASSLMLGARPVFAVSLTATKPIVEYELSPGEVVQDSIELANGSEFPLKVKIYLQDWRYVAPGNGDKEFAPPQTLPRSCAGWISFLPQSADVPAHGNLKVDYAVSVPKEYQALDGGYYAVLFFEARIDNPQAIEENTVGVKYAMRIGSLFTVKIKGTVRREAHLSSLSVTPPTPSDSLKVSGQFTNDGNVALKCAGSMNIMAPDNMVAGRGDLGTICTWPGLDVPIAAEWNGNLAKGSYSVVLTYDCGEELVIVEEAKTAVP